MCRAGRAQEAACRRRVCLAGATQRACVIDPCNMLRMHAHGRRRARSPQALYAAACPQFAPRAPRRRARERAGAPAARRRRARAGGRAPNPDPRAGLRGGRGGDRQPRARRPAAPAQRAAGRRLCHLHRLRPDQRDAGRRAAGPARHGRVRGGGAHAGRRRALGRGPAPPLGPGAERPEEQRSAAGYWAWQGWGAEVCSATRPGGKAAIS